MEELCRSALRRHDTEGLDLGFRLAAANGHIEIVKNLITYVDPTHLDHDALRVAASRGHMDVVECLLHHCNPAACSDGALRAAARNGHLNVVKLLAKDKRVTLSALDNEAFRLSAENGHLHVVKFLFSQDSVDPTACDNFALRWASRNGHTDVVRYLLSSSNSIRLDMVARREAIRLARMHRRLETVVELLTTASSEDTYDRKLVRWAIARAAKRQCVGLLTKLLGMLEWTYITGHVFEVMRGSTRKYERAVLTLVDAQRNVAKARLALTRVLRHLQESSPLPAVLIQSILVHAHGEFIPGGTIQMKTKYLLSQDTTHDSKAPKPYKKRKRCIFHKEKTSNKRVCV